MVDAICAVNPEDDASGVLVGELFQAGVGAWKSYDLGVIEDQVAGTQIGW